jgi:hypothetical protein
MAKKILSFVWLLFFVLGGTGMLSSQELRLVEQDEGGVTVELTLPQFELKPVQGDDGMYQKIVLPNWARTSQVGFPDLPLKGTLLQVPETGDIRVEVLQQNVKTLENCRIYPVPRPIVNDRQVTWEFARDAEFYGSNASFPSQVAEIGTRGIWQDVCVAQLKIFPFRYYPRQAKLEYWQSLRLRIVYQSPLRPTGVQGSNDAKFRQQVILNYRSDCCLGASKTQEPLTPLTYEQGMRIEVRAAGIYRLTYEKLTQAGLPADISPSRLRLFHRHEEVACKMVARGDKLQPGDYLEFYAPGLDNAFTRNDVYWLFWGHAPGKRMQRRNGAVHGQPEQITTFTETLRCEKNHTFWESMPGPITADRWFWKKVTAPAGDDYSTTVPSPLLPASGASLRVCYRGRSTAPPNPNHHTQVYLNNTLVADNLWNGDGEYIQEGSASQLLDGSNQLRVVAPGDTGAAVDIFYLAWYEITYTRRLQAVADKLAFTTPKKSNRQQFTITGFNQKDLRVYDISDPVAPREIVQWTIVAGARSYAVTFSDQATNAKTYYVASGQGVAEPADVRLWHTTHLKNCAQGADYLLLTGKEFLPYAEPLCQWHQSQSLRVKAVAVEDIYDEFNYGIFEPQAIRTFLAYAYNNWQSPAPAYVLLLGDANTDYRDYLATGKKNIVPVMLSMTSFGVTPDDNAYVCLRGNDVLPELGIGRIPAKDGAAVTSVVNKLLGYAQARPAGPRRAMFVADNDDNGFDSVNDGLAISLPATFTARKVYLRNYPNTASATADLIAGLNEGMLLTTYVGHASTTYWAAESIFSNAYVPGLTNSQWPFVLTYCCLNGYFSLPSGYCTSEELVIAPNKGAIAAFSPTGLGWLWEHQILSSELFAQIFTQHAKRLGTIARQGKIAAYAKGAPDETVQTFTLLGDPATLLQDWE